MNKSKLASLGERLKSGGAQMSRLVTMKVREMKDLLQSPIPESKIVDQATASNLESPDWGLNLRICSLINAEELSGTEIVRAIKKKIIGNDAVSQRLGLELLEACAMNCEKVFSEIASERVLEEMVRVVESVEAERECRVRALEMIRAWGESADLNYLPVFRQTYENLQRRDMSSQVEDGSLPAMHYPLESHIDQHPVSPLENYPIPETESNGATGTSLQYGYGSLSVEQKKEFFEITRNSVEVLSSLLNSTQKPDVTKEDDLMISMLEKCRESQPVLQRLVETTTDDEGMLFDALSLHDELQLVISKFEKIEASDKPEEARESNSTDGHPPVQAKTGNLDDKEDNAGTRDSALLMGIGDSSGDAK